MSLKLNSMTSRPSGLHDEILKFAAKLTPNPEEHESCEKVIEILRKLTYEAFGHDAELSPFGSYASGLTARNSDLDLVITGLLKPDTPEGFFGCKQNLVVEHLEILQEQMQRSQLLNVVEIQFIKHAKFPVLKVALQEGIWLDISLNDEMTTRASSYFLEKVRQYPPLRPLCLIVKAFLKTYGLGEVRDGGLGGYAVANLVMAHLQETIKSDKPTHDFGELLITFFLRFGRQFDSDRCAISVRKGGIISKPRIQFPGNRRSGSAQNQVSSWFIENPVTGRDVALGSYKVGVIRGLFIDAYHALKKKKSEGERSLSIIFNLQS